MSNEIGLAKQQGTSIYVYDTKGNFLFNKSGELLGFTSSTVSVKTGSSVYVYDSKGNFLFNK
jgi:hypothetical protein